MSERNDGGPAFPGGVNQVYTHIDEGEPTQPGMSIRDYFAAKAMQGMVSAKEYATGYWELDSIAERAYRMADNMLAEKERT